MRSNSENNWKMLSPNTGVGQERMNSENGQVNFYGVRKVNIRKAAEQQVGGSKRLQIEN